MPKDGIKRKRRWPGVTNPIYKPYVVAIGQLALAWNELHVPGAPRVPNA
jgi:hypothetical protein